MANVILMAIGIGLMIGGIVVTIMEAPEAKSDLDSLETDLQFALIMDKELSHKDYLTDKASIIIRHYWKTAIMALSGAGIIFWSYIIQQMKM